MEVLNVLVPTFRQVADIFSHPQDPENNGGDRRGDPEEVEDQPKERLQQRKVVHEFELIRPKVCAPLCLSLSIIPFFHAYVFSESERSWNERTEKV